MLYVLHPAIYVFRLDINPIPLLNPSSAAHHDLFYPVMAPKCTKWHPRNEVPSSDAPHQHRHRRDHADDDHVEGHHHRRRHRRADHERVKGDKHAGDAHSHKHRHKDKCKPESTLKRLASGDLPTQTHVIVFFQWESIITDCNLPRHPTFKPWFMVSNQHSSVCSIHVFDVFLHICWVAHFNFFDVVSHTCSVCMMFIVLIINQN